ncbi:FAD-dependent oxidoreductase [Ruminococcaceae bacterium OttesenSCG-928-I18]|nr:FAD-dependent oxidoreductase [Ruminococcaceae bacterium OttesenSCG-928-I18]
MTDIIIVGAGPAGLTAAIYAARAGMQVVVFDKSVYGGQVSLTSEVDNYPGVQGLAGADFATNLYTHAVSQGAEVRFEEVTDVDITAKVKTVTTSTGKYESKALIFAGGASRKKLGVPGEETFMGHGVSFCATCDAAFFREKTVAIVGGGDTALSDALFLANNCEKIYLIHRRGSFRAAHAEQEAVRARENIEVLYSTTVERIEGIDRVERIIVNTPEGNKTLAVSGIFIAIGLEPETSLFKGHLPLNEKGYVLAQEDCSTPFEGVWVAGDLREKPLRQIVTAAADGAVAAVAASEYLNAGAAGGTCSLPTTPPGF